MVLQVGSEQRDERPPVDRRFAEPQSREPDARI